MIKKIVDGIARHLLTIVAGVLVSKGLTDQSGAQELVGALMALGSVAWSIYEKVKQK